MLTKENFKEKVEQAGKPAVVKYGTSHCTSCRLMDSVLDKLKRQFSDSVVFYSVDIEEEPAFAERLQADRLPYVEVWSSCGEIHSSYYGAIGLRVLTDDLTQVLEEGSC